jgi:predicted lysophospholipase L1 biosynthesis ABC-type transport system permease subunit
MSSRTTVILLGGAIGAALGAAAAWTYLRQQEAHLPANALGVRKPVEMSAGAADLIKIAVAVLGIVRQFDDLFKPKKLA